MLLGNVFDKGNDLKRGGRVQTRRGLVEKQQFGTGDELRGDAHATLLTARDALADGGANEVVRLAGQTKGVEKGVDALATLESGDGRGEGETGGKVERFAHGEGTDEGVFLLDVGADVAEGMGMGGAAVDVDGGFDRSLEAGGAVGEDVEEG